MRPQKNITAFVFSAILGTSLFHGSAVDAQEPRRGETVLTRERPEWDPIGLRLSGFLLFPELAVTQNYNDNIFADRDGEISDYIIDIQPRLRVESDWNNHALNLQADADIGRYLDNSAENFEDYRFLLDGRLDITRETLFLGGVGYAQNHEKRGSPDDVGGSEPTRFTVSEGFARFRHGFNRLTVQMDGRIREHDFHNVPGSNGIIINDDRDRTRTEGGLRFSYEFIPQVEGFIRGVINTQSYNTRSDDTGLDRSSSGYLAVIGTDIDFTGITFGEIYAGYLFQDLDDPGFNDVEGYVFGGLLTWNVTGLTTVRFDVEREIEETTVGRASSVFASRAGVMVDHELLRNLLLNASFFFTREEFEGIDRNDNLYEVEVGSKYLLNRYLYLSLGYRYTRRDTEQPGEGNNLGYEENVIGFTAQLNY